MDLVGTLKIFIMKKIFFIAVLMLVGYCCKAQNDMFFRLSDADNEMFRDVQYDNVNIGLPAGHGLDYDSDAPLGSGLLVFAALGAGYAAFRRRHQN